MPVWIFAVFFLLLGGGSYYILWRFHRFNFVASLAGGRRWLTWLLGLVPLGVIALLCLWNVYAGLIVWLHLLMLLPLGDLIGHIVRRVQKKPRRDIAGLVTLCLIAVYLAVGWFCAHHVFETHVRFTTDKALPGGRLRIVEIADAHLGATLDGEAFAAQMERVQATQPDLVVIVGDFIDDDTKKEDMLTACQALGSLKTTYGVYYVYGNHDRGYFRTRDYGDPELRQALTENGVTILEDQAVTLDGFALVGRKDRSNRGRLSASELTSSLDPALYTVMLDHQPNDYDGEAASGADLVLSGHTHGGHVFPAGLLGLAMGSNDHLYGAARRGNTDFYVTSGISGWAIPFKTLCISEFAVIDVTSAVK